MNKDFDIKHDQHYHMNHLRGRITETAKESHEGAEEFKGPQGKVLFEIPVTGSKGLNKFENNKWVKKFN